MIVVRAIYAQRRAVDIVVQDAVGELDAPDDGCDARSVALDREGGTARGFIRGDGQPRRLPTASLEAHLRCRGGLVVDAYCFASYVLDDTVHEFDDTSRAVIPNRANKYPSMPFYAGRADIIGARAGGPEPADAILEANRLSMRWLPCS